VTECPEPEYTGCTRDRKLCDDGADQEDQVKNRWYSCPTCPVDEPEPGNCPICGKPLEGK